MCALFYVTQLDTLRKIKQLKKLHSMAPTSKIVNPLLHNSALQNYRHTLIIVILNLH